MTTRLDLWVREGATYSKTYTKVDAAGAAIDLSGYSARMSVKRHINSSAAAYLSTGADADGGTLTLGGAAGTIEISMTATETAGFKDNWLPFPGDPPRSDAMSIKFHYDLELVDASGAVTRELEGSFWLQREVTG